MQRKFRLVMHEREVQRMVREQALAIHKAFSNSPCPLVLVGVLDAAVPFMCSLVAELHVLQGGMGSQVTPFTLQDAEERSNLKVRWVVAHSFKKGNRVKDLTHQDVKLLFPESDIEGANVVVVDTILDSGKTASAVGLALRAGRYTYLGFAGMFARPSREELAKATKFLYSPRYQWVGWHLPKELGFLVGFGLDWDGAFREWPSVFELFQD